MPRPSGWPLALVPAAPAGAATRPGDIFPTEFALPTGFQPEGIAIGAMPLAYFGSLVDGDIYRVNLITGDGRIISQGPGTPSVGMKIDHRGRLFVAGGDAGDARVVSAFTGEILETYPFVTPPATTFVNDVVLTRGRRLLHRLAERVPLRGAASAGPDGCPTRPTWSSSRSPATGSR